MRLDLFMVQKKLAQTRSKAQILIKNGQVLVNGQIANKTGLEVDNNDKVEINGEVNPFVSKGGLKLKKAIDAFNLDFSGKNVIDIGASTGGFTDVLLQNGAKEVVALDVGQGLLDPKIANDPRVIIKDKTNFKLLQPGDLGEPFDVVVTDVSFISLTKILPNAVPMMKDDAYIVALIKPQFEAERYQVPEGGVITDPDLQIEIIEKLISSLGESGLFLHDISPVPLVSRRKNIEFVSLWKKTEPLALPDFRQIVYDSHSR